MSNQVTTIDAYSKLAQHQGEYIYFRTDHHWTQLGAYYGYTAFAEKTGIATPSDITKLRTIDVYKRQTPSQVLIWFCAATPMEDSSGFR